MGWLPTIEYVPPPTYTKQPTYTPGSTCIPTKTPVSPTATINDQQNPSPAPSLTPTPYFYEGFKSRNENPWNLSPDYYNIPEVKSLALDIENGKLDLYLNCYIDSNKEEQFKTNICQADIKIPTTPRENFDISLKVKIEERSFGAIGITTSSIDRNESLTFLYTTEPAFLFIKRIGSIHPQIEKTENVYSIGTLAGSENDISISFLDSEILAMVNGEIVYTNDGRSIDGDNIVYITVYSEGLNNIHFLIDELYLVPNVDSVE